MILLLFMGSQQILASLGLMTVGMDFVVEHMYLFTLLSYGVVFLGLLVVNYMEKESFRDTYSGFTLKTLLQAMMYAVPMWLLVTLINGIFMPFFPEYEGEITS